MTEEEANARNPNRANSGEELEAISSGTKCSFQNFAGVLYLSVFPIFLLCISEESIDTKIANSNCSVAVNPVVGGEIYEGHVPIALRTRHLALRFMVSTPETLLHFPLCVKISDRGCTPDKTSKIVHLFSWAICGYVCTPDI